MTRAGLNRSRQHDLFRVEQSSPVMMIGAGGIGSAAALELAKMGVEDLTVFDFDRVEDENLNSQWYLLDDVGKPKVEALAAGVRSSAGFDLKARCERYEDQPLEGVVIAAVDSMAVRSKIWEQVKLNPSVDLFIDARMGGLVALVQAVRPCDPDDIRRYEARLHGDDAAAQEPCTGRAIVFNTFGVASIISAILRRWWVDGELIPMRTIDWSTLTML